MSMLKNLSLYQNLGTFNYFFELLNILKDGKGISWRIKDINNLFYNRIIDGRNIFDGCIHLLNSIEIISINSKNIVIPDSSFFKYLSSKTLAHKRIVERLITKIGEDPIFYKIFSPEYISYDIIYKGIQIDNSAFPLKYSTFKQLLLDLKILNSHPTKTINKYIFNNKYKKLFDKVLLPEIRKRKMGVDELRLLLEKKQIHGEEAEKFVLAFEEKRLNGSKKIDWVAEYSISEGYDIASFNNEESEFNDRFIEVKSYSGNPYFFWSKNEIEISRIKKSEYYLYLVNREKIQENNYHPIILKNPYLNVYQNTEQWEQRIEKIRFELKPGQNI